MSQTNATSFPVCCQVVEVHMLDRHKTDRMSLAADTTDD